ncbi:hypothetical protein NIES593_19845 [Hydrococcus rivularis NIES-593]|uniref:Uncharacterized protein n=1 Tax=Hydrococcus rivularis NIES-593 TaxID=1921803 RepID=A0A1U7H9A9_9CYAN|nr:hypothetical protein [Hydrococcus rivularis]OKH20144.1 hypothetical protein NIES593_19845 [Hydrococcus rivularis NIES-593]
MEITAPEAEELALSFLVEDLEIPPDEQDYFAVLNSRPIGEDWYVVEIGVEGFPDKWVIQVYDTHECDPCYTFVSPMPPTEANTDLDELPQSLAEVLLTHRSEQKV